MPDTCLKLPWRIITDGSRQFLDVMIKVSLDGANRNEANGRMWTASLGRSARIRGCCTAIHGHPELELAVMRLYQTTKDPEHLAFARVPPLFSRSASAGSGRERELFHLRGQAASGRGRPSHSGEHLLPDVSTVMLPGLTAGTTSLTRLCTSRTRSLATRSGATVPQHCGSRPRRASFLTDAERLFHGPVDHKMYATGGLGTEPGE